MGFASHDRVIEIVDHLPPVGQCVLDLLSIAADVDASADDAAKILMRDGVLTGRVLAEANSAFYATVSPISTARSAVARLGVARVAAIAMNATAMASFPLGALPYGLDSKEIEDHQMAAAEAALILGQHLPAGVRGDLTTVAVLHDVGKLVMSMVISDLLCDEGLPSPAGVPITDVEIELFDMHHAEVGRVVCDHWQIPAIIGDAVQHHHSPGEGGVLAHGAYVVDAIAKVVAESTDRDLDDFPLLRGSMATLSLSNRHVESAIEHLKVAGARVVEPVSTQ